MPAKGKKYFQIASLEKGIRILELLAVHEELTVSKAAELMGLNRAGCHRFLATLRELGWVEKNELGRYQLTFRVLELGIAVANRFEIRLMARPFMQALSEASRETVNLGYWDGRTVIHLDKIDSLEVLRMDSPLGSVAEAYCTGLGKAILAHLPAGELETYLSGVIFKPHGPNMITDQKMLLKELDAIKCCGVAVDNEELALGLCCVASPVFDYQQYPRYALSISGPAFRLTPERIEALQPIVKAQCENLSAQLGRPLRRAARPATES